MPSVFEKYADPGERAKTVRRLDSQRQETRMGPGALLETPQLARRHGISHALVVTDAHLRTTGAMRVLIERLGAEGVRTTVTDQVTSPPIEQDIDDGVRRFKEAGCDGLVSFGGGAVHDVAKCVALLAAEGGRIHDFAENAPAGARRRATRKHPHVAVNTTAGTGAERSSFAFVTEAQGHAHDVLHDPLLIPEAAVLDPLTHLSMPADVTAATGMNALADAVEAFVSLARTERSDGMALRAMQGIGLHLPKAYEDGDDLEARSGMAEAAYDAGRAYDEAGLGIVDSISLVLSSVYSLPHSLAKAIVLPHVMAYDAFVVGDRMGQIATALGRNASGKDAAAMAEEALAAVQELRHRVGITETLGDLGLDWDAVYMSADRILHHPFIERNPRPLDRDGLVDILLGALEKQEVHVAPTRAA